jgi:hypothetical protein
LWVRTASSGFLKGETSTRHRYLELLSGQCVWKLANKHQISSRADIFNLLNVHKPVNYDQDYEAAMDAPNANFMNVLNYQTARRVRLGLKYQF